MPMSVRNLSILLAAGVATPVSAQFEPMFNPVQMANDQMNNHLIFRPVRDAAARPDSNSDNREQVVPQINEAALVYTPSQSRRRSNLSAFVDRTRKVDPSGASAMQQLTSNSDIIGQIDQMMRSVGLRADNVADAYSLWWVAAWEAVNGQDAGSSSAMYSAVKQQASNSLLSTPQFGSTTNAEKQELSESLLIQAALIDAHIDAAADNPTQQAALAKAVNQGAKKMGLDLTTMDLTENGFVPRSGGRSDASDAVEGADPTAAPTDMAANDDAGASAGESDTGKLALYGVGGVALLAGMFALGKSFGGKG